MKILRTPPDIDMMIEVEDADLEEPWMKQGLKIPFEFNNGKKAYYWRVGGSWILLILKPAKPGETVA